MTIKGIRENVGKIYKEGKGKNPKQRNKILHKYNSTLIAIRERSDRIDLHTKCLGYNPFRITLNKLTSWTIGSPKRRKDTPSEIKPNMKTNNRIYSNSGNYYKKPKIRPTKAELHDPDINQDVINLRWLRHHLKDRDKNRRTLSKMIYQTKLDLATTIKSKRGINHRGRTDNEPSPKGKSLDDKLILNDYLDSKPMVKLLFNGYNESEIAQKRGVSVATVSRHLHQLIHN